MQISAVSWAFEDLARLDLVKPFGKDVMFLVSIFEAYRSLSEYVFHCFHCSFLGPHIFHSFQGL